MPCTLCKNGNHTLTECSDVSIHTKIDEISSICISMISLPENATTLQDATELINRLTTYLNRLNAPMLKAIVCNTLFFKYIPNPGGEVIVDHYFNGYGPGCSKFDISGSKKVLISKVKYLFLTNTRRGHPIEFLKKNHHFRELWFGEETYSKCIKRGDPEEIAMRSKLRNPRLFETCYSAWLTALKQDSEELINQSFDNFRENNVSSSEFNLYVKRDKEANFHAIHNNYSNEVLDGVLYTGRDALYLKKKIMEYLISLYNGSIEYSYCEGETIVLRVNNIPEEVPLQGLSLSVPSQSHPQPQIQIQPQPAFNAVHQPVVDPQFNLDARLIWVIQQIMPGLQVDALFQALAPAPVQVQSQPVNLRKLNIEVVIDKRQITNCLEFECSICMDNTKTTNDEKLALSCNHELCGSCVVHYLNDYRSKTSHPTCPLCRAPIQKITAKNENIPWRIIQDLHNICI